MKYKAVIFDLDGTLLNTLDDIADSANNALASLGFPAHPVADYRYFVGDGVKKLVQRILPENSRSGELVDTCHKKMIEEYSRRWNNKTGLYEGVAEMLDGVAERGLKTAVLSNKPDHFTQKCVAEFLDNWRFDEVAGFGPDVPLKPDPGGALEMARRLSVPPESVVLVGDSDIDIKTAVLAGMYPIGVLWGFRTGDELSKSGARTLAGTPRDILETLDSRTT